MFQSYRNWTITTHLLGGVVTNVHKTGSVIWVKNVNTIEETTSRQVTNYKPCTTFRIQWFFSFIVLLTAIIIITIWTDRHAHKMTHSNNFYGTDVAVSHKNKQQPLWDYLELVASSTRKTLGTTKGYNTLMWRVYWTRRLLVYCKTPSCQFSSLASHHHHHHTPIVSLPWHDKVWKFCLA